MTRAWICDDCELGKFSSCIPQALDMENMPEVKDWPDSGKMDYKGSRYKIKNRTADPFPYVIRHQPGLSKTALLLQLDLIQALDKEESTTVPGRMAPKRYPLCNTTAVHEIV
jgi:hypothetical protein